jgi:hypothetical protein
LDKPSDIVFGYDEEISRRKPLSEKKSNFEENCFYFLPLLSSKLSVFVIEKLYLFCKSISNNILFQDIFTYMIFHLLDNNSIAQCLRIIQGCIESLQSLNNSTQYVKNIILELQSSSNFIGILFFFLIVYIQNLN